MARKKTDAEVRPAWFMPDELIRVPVGDLVPYARNARTHSDAQIAQLRASLREFGFVNPVLIDGERNIIAGHGRVLAAQAEGMTEVPCVLVEHLTDTQRRAYILADNRLAEMSGWDMEMVSLELGDLQDADFDLTLTGFNEMDLELEPPEDDAPAKKTASAENDDFADEEAEKAPPDQKLDDEERLRQAFDAGMQAAEYGEADEAYAEFVEKFKPKKQRTIVIRPSWSMRRCVTGQYANMDSRVDRWFVRFIRAEIISG